MSGSNQSISNPQKSMRSRPGQTTLTVDPLQLFPIPLKLVDDPIDDDHPLPALVCLSVVIVILLRSSRSVELQGRGFGSMRQAGFLSMGESSESSSPSSFRSKESVERQGT